VWVLDPAETTRASEPLAKKGKLVVAASGCGRKKGNALALRGGGPCECERKEPRKKERTKAETAQALPFVACGSPGHFLCWLLGLGRGGFSSPSRPFQIGRVQKRYSTGFFFVFAR
jgi:hypothetical protein